MTSQHAAASPGDYVLAALLLVAIILGTLRGLLWAIGYRKPRVRRTTTYVTVDEPQVSRWDTLVGLEERLREAEHEDVHDSDAARRRVLEDEASLLPVITRPYR